MGKQRLSLFQIVYNCEMIFLYSVQFSSVAQLCLTLCDPMNRSMLGLPVHHQLPEFTQTHVHWVSDAIQPFHPLSSPSPPAPSPSQHQRIFQWVNSSHEVAKVLEFQLQHHSLQRKMQIKTTVRYDLTPTRMAIIKKATTNKCWWGCGKKGTLIHCWWECKLVQLL